MTTQTAPEQSQSNSPLSHQDLRPQFWQQYALHEFSHNEWEALCDGCGGCCLIKFLQPEDTADEVEYTDVACQLLDCHTGWCSNYPRRHHYVPDCIQLTVEQLPEMMWLPEHCAYKRLYLGQPLPHWHLLNTQDAHQTRQYMHTAGIGVAGRCVSEHTVTEAQMEERVITWVRA